MTRVDRAFVQDLLHLVFTGVIELEVSDETMRVRPTAPSGDDARAEAREDVIVDDDQ